MGPHAITIFSHLFLGAAAPSCLDGADANDSDVVDISDGALRRKLHNGDLNGDGVRDVSDALRLLNFLFQGGPEPIPIEEESPPPEVLAKLQASAVDVVASLPSEVQIAAMPPRLGRYMASIRRRWTAAAMEAPSWSWGQYQGFQGFVDSTNDSWPIVADRLQAAFPGLIDQEYLDQCDLQRLLCVDLFEDIEGSCDYDCEWACEVELAVCRMRCPIWIKFPVH